MSLLRVEALSKSFGGVQAVDNLSFTVAAGMVYAVIGPNGAGKTTLFNLITGVYTPSGGRVYLDDADITGRPPYRLARRGLSRTFQNLQIFYNMTALENIMLGGHLHADTGLVRTLIRAPSIVRSDAACRERAEQILAFVGLDRYHTADADSLPYGALKRLEIARALAVEPRLLLLDEPAAGCNATETGELEALIRAIVARGVTVLLVEHDMKLVMEISDRVLVLDYGRRLAEGAPAEVRANHEVIAAYLGAG